MPFALMTQAAATVDARGQLCPLPTVKTALALEKLQPGQTVELRADDPVTKRDLPAWCRERGHRVTRAEEQGAEFRLWIEKGT